MDKNGQMIIKDNIEKTMKNILLSPSKSDPSLEELNPREDILFNGIKTPDGTVISSKYRHDYQTYIDKNGKTYMIDGGFTYTRSSGNGDEEFITLTTNDKHDVIRELFEWGTYGKNGKQELKYIKLKDMGTNHIKNCLKGDINKSVRFVMINELKRREVDTCTPKQKL